MSFLNAKEQKTLSDLLISVIDSATWDHEIKIVSSSFNFKRAAICVTNIKDKQAIISFYSDDNGAFALTGREFYCNYQRHGDSTMWDVKGNRIYCAEYHKGKLVHVRIPLTQDLSRESFVVVPSVCNCPIADLWNGRGHTCGIK